ncbi:MAG TPA: Spy/CpxP family protein refolding chaperone [Rhodopila sp.]|jgi:protein CpxP|nr:Spy/CpxP family protein refolding chaperone [Rhodopila sp.]
MTIKSSSCAVALLASLVMPAVSLPVGAFAQPPTSPARPQAAPSKTQSPMDRVEQHITDLHKQLHITSAQQGQWDEFAQVMRDNAKGMTQSLDQRGASLASMTAPENMQSYAQLAQQHAQDMQKLAAAFQTLYGSFSDEQKKNADDVFRTRGEQHAAAQH